MNSIAGELNILLSQNNNQIDCEIASSRPMQSARVFSGKSIEKVLSTLPLLYSVCGKAQAVTAVRAIESAKQMPADKVVEDRREALVYLESLREQSFRILIDWPEYLGESPDNQKLASVVQGTNKLMQSLLTEQLLGFDAKQDQSSDTNGLASSLKNQWRGLSENLEQVIFASSAEGWLEMIAASIDGWAERQQTQAARFIYWLGQQDWKLAGTSNIEHLQEIDNQELANRLRTEMETFTAQPDWQSSCYELSWFSNNFSGIGDKRNIISSLSDKNGNGIYTRMVARLLEVAQLLQRLNGFFLFNEEFEMPLVYEYGKGSGLAHTTAARGRLTHYVELDGDSVSRLLILAPTEWNFHPQGVAKDSLCNLHVSNEADIERQARLLIHAIDPCVGYQLKIDSKD